VRHVELQEGLEPSDLFRARFDERADEVGHEHERPLQDRHQMHRAGGVALNLLGQLADTLLNLRGGE